MSIYKGEKLVAGGSIDTHVVRRPVWSKAIELSPVDLTAGYKAPADGIIVGSFYHSGTGRDYYFTLNGTNIMPVLAKKGTNGDIARPLTLSLTVNQGDMIGCAALSASDIELSPSIKFVPFEDSTISKSDVEVVSPELIRNLHDPDWSKIQYYTPVQLNENITIPARGIFICTAYPISVSPASIVYLKINGKNVDWSFRDNANGDIRKFNFSGPVCKGDVVTVTQHIQDSNIIAFVPYKAQ